MDWYPLFLSFKLALISSLILLLIGIPLAYLLSFRRFRFASVLEALIALPMVLPPTVLGFYFIVLFSPNSMLGQFLDEHLGFSLVFSFPGLVFGSVLYSLPFMVQPIQNGFSQLPSDMLNFARVLGRSDLDIFKRIILPNTIPALITGFVLSFAHTLGEFGLVIMIGGNIPEETKVASIAIFEAVELLRFEEAALYSGVLLGVSFLILLLVYSLGFRKNQPLRW